MKEWIKEHRAALAAFAAIGFMAFMTFIYYGVQYAVSEAYNDFTQFPVGKWFSFGTLLVIGGASVFFVIWFLILKRKASFEILAVAAVAFWGLIFMFVLPPASGPDEDNFYVTSYELSNHLLFQKETSKDDYVYMRASDAEFLLHRDPGADDYQIVFDHFFDKCDDKTMVLTGMKKREMVFWDFLPQAIGISVARIFGMGQIGAMYLARFLNFLLYMVLFYLAIKRMPFGKHIFLCISLFPMVLEQISSMSYDVQIIGLSFYFIAQVFDLAYKKDRVTWKDIVLLAVTLGLLAPTKVIYVMLGFLCFLIPRKKFKSMHEKISDKQYYALAILIVAGLASATVLYAQSDRFGQYLAGTNATRPSANATDHPVQSYEDAEKEGSLPNEEVRLYSFSDVLHEPMKMILIFGNTIRTEWSRHLTMIFGSHLGWHRILLSGHLIYAFLALYLGTCIRKESEGFLPKTKDRAVMGAVILIVGLLAYLFMLVGWTTYNNAAMICEGIQGRYYLPLLPLFAVCLWNTRIGWSQKENKEGTGSLFLVFSSSMLLWWSVMDIFCYTLARLGSNMVG
ncbi:MAG: DUF2142 domain-containing protein [Lachnospiraceae bacterium]|nr:DUF2142 domain-containing protein [Lachnospiraceae bacterium]